MDKKLEFRRQFLLTIAPITPLDDWACLQIDQYYLYTHPDLDVNIEADPKKSIVLIGNIYDSAEPQKENAEILSDIIASAHSIECFISYIKRYAGRYALIYKGTKETIIFPDALALRELYYCTGDNKIVCGSQPNLVAKFSNPKILPRSDPDFLEFYTNHMKDSRWNPIYKWIGDTTYYEGIKHLLPNHCLDINRREAHRFWPNEPIKRVDLDEAVSKSCKFLQGNMEAMVHRHSVMMAVTAGTDTRTLLAASKDIHHKIYYFVNDHDLHYRPDVSVPKEMFESIGVPFNVHYISNDVDERFRQIFLNNSFFATDRIMSTIYNVYYKKLGDKINIIGIGEIGRTRFGKEPKNLNGYRLAYKIGHKDDRYAIQECEQILAEMIPSYRKFGINVLTGFYWEQMLGNWGVTGNSESDIAIEEVNPFNSHMLYEIFLGAEDKYTKYAKSILFREMIGNMWPELINWPINPPYNLRSKIQNYLKKTGVFEWLKEFKYQINFISYSLKR